MYHYAGNNPVRYVDPDGREVLTASAIFLVGLFALFTVEAYLQTPAGQQGVQAFGEALSCAFDNTTKTISNVANAIKTDIAQQKEVANLAKTRVSELTKAQTKSESTGSYVIVFESGKTYCGKGGQSRAAKSAVRESVLNNDLPILINWKSAINHREAFKDEYKNIEDNGGPQNNLLGDHFNYNRIQSPGKIYYYIDNGHFYTPNSREAQ